MSFLNVTAKLGNMRKEVEWTVYPFKQGEESWVIQSDTRIARVYRNGKVILSKAKSSGAYFVHLNPMLGATKETAPAELLTALEALMPTGSTIKIGG
jgi:hypothetical protein